MKKQELRAMKLLIATDSMIQNAKQDIAQKYERYFRAAVQRKILKVAVFVRQELVNEKKEPLYEVYVDREKNEFSTYEPAQDKWRTAKINMLEYGIYYMRMHEEWQSDADRKLVNAYFETGKNLNIFQAVLDFQCEVRKEQLNKKYRSEIELIDATMKEVPELPKNFDDWVIKNCFKETLFYQRERPYHWPKVYCTHCGEWMDAPTYEGKPEHRKSIKCPKCGVNATYRSWNKQKYVEDRTDVAILQKLKDGSGYILRSFDVKIKRNHKNGWETAEYSKHENVRQRMNLQLRREDIFEYGEYKYTGVFRWCHYARRSIFGYNANFGQTLMYTPNLKQVLRDKPFSSMDLKQTFRGGERKRVDATYILGMLEDFPFLEYLQKSGLYTLEREVWRNKTQVNFFDRDAGKIHDVLKLNKQEFQRLRKIDGGKNVVLALRYEQETGKRLTDEMLRYIKSKEINVEKVLTITLRTNMNLQRTLNYLKRQQDELRQEFGETLQYYKDYLDMAKERGMDITDEIVCRNSRMIEYHNRYLEEKNREKNNKRDCEVDKKFKNIRKDYEKNMKHFAYETKEYVFMVPKKASDITQEGRLQHHCVGASDTYMRKMNEGNTYILFLRKEENVELPYYTLEVKWDGEIIQFYAAYDRKPNKENIERILKLWQKEIKKRLSAEAEKQIQVAV